MKNIREIKKLPDKKWMGTLYCPFRTGTSITQCTHPSNIHDGKLQDCLLVTCPFSRKPGGSQILIESKKRGEKIWTWQKRMRQEAGPVHIKPMQVVIMDEIKMEGLASQEQNQIDKSIEWITRLGQSSPEEMRQIIAVEIQAHQKDLAYELISSSNIKNSLINSVKKIMEIIDPYLPPILEIIGSLPSDNTPRIMDQDCAQWVFDRIIRKTCKNCQAPLSPKQMMHYDHKSGWEITGYAKKQWVYITCGKCGHQWSLSKLGVSRLG